MAEDYEFHLEPFGQQPGLWNLYTQLTFCFPLEDTSRHAAIVETLTKGLKRLTDSFPWIAGQVVKQKWDNKAPDYFVIKPFQSFPRLIVKDLSQHLPTCEEYEAHDFPIRFLDENLIAPRNTKSTSAEEDPKPVFLAQVTFIKGGVLFTFAAQHGTMDIVGQCEMTRLLSQACHDIAFSNEELLQGNRDRRLVVPLLDENERPNPRVRHETVETESEQVNVSRSAPASSSEPASPSANVWANFTCTSTSLQALKGAASANLLPGTTFVSTDDALSAFIWQCVTRARLPRHGSKDTSTFARTVDVRRYLDIASNYPGNLATKTFTTNTFEQLVNEPLGTVASQLRISVDPEKSKLAYKTRAAATDLARPTSGKASTNASRDLSKDIAFSSWAKVDYCYNLDFNLDIGKPVAVRRPAFALPNEQPMEGVVYLLPKRPDGEITVTMCLNEDDMQRLRADEKWNEFARYTG